MTGSAAKPVPVFVYYDYTCPYSYLALFLLDAASAECRLDIVWRPLERRPELPPQGASGSELADLPDESEWSEIVERAASLGVPIYRPARVPVTNEALQATEFAGDLGKEARHRLHRAIFRAYFVLGDDIGRRDRLLEIARAEGIDREALNGALDDGRYRGELEEAEVEARRYGIEQTPTMLFGRFKVVGAAPPEVIREAAQRAAAE